jgi:uncharacterized membrane protein YfcA
MIEITREIILLIIGAGFLAGFINTLAGSGSIITLPLLMFLGLPANVANGTNRIMILLTNIVGVSSFKHQKVFKFKESIWLTIPAIIGAIIGAKIAVDINEELMTKIIGGLMIFLLFTIIYKPQRWLTEPSNQTKKFKPWQYLVLFLVGLYGGFIQVGVGVFLLSGLVLSAGYDLVKANAIKLFIILIYTLFALTIFFFNDQVNITAGLLLAAGSMTGSFIATKVAVTKGVKFVRWILIIVIIFASAKLLGIFNFINQLFV